MAIRKRIARLIFILAALIMWVASKIDEPETALCFIYLYQQTLDAAMKAVSHE